MISAKGFEVRPYTMDDLSFKPTVYQNDVDGHADLTIFSHYGMLFVDGEEKPLEYFRHSNTDSVRWGGIGKLGDDVLLPNSEAHFKDLAQKNAKVNKYHFDTDHYEFSTDEPYCKISFYDNHASWIEGKDGSILDVKAERFPLAMIGHKDSVMNTPIWHQHAIITGTYEGKKVRGMGAYDRTFISHNLTQDYLFSGACTYISAVYSGIREDGRRESFYSYIGCGKNGFGLAFYYLDGEEPVISDKLHLDTEWYHLPYSPNDKTVVFKDAVWKFANKEIHFNGHWGAKGFWDKPRIESEGLVHSLGTWYEGSVPYKHQLYHGFNECLFGTDDIIESAGYKIIK